MEHQVSYDIMQSTLVVYIQTQILLCLRQRSNKTIILNNMEVT